MHNIDSATIFKILLVLTGGIYSGVRVRLYRKTNRAYKKLKSVGLGFVLFLVPLCLAAAFFWYLFSGSFIFDASSLSVVLVIVFGIIAVEFFLFLQGRTMTLPRTGKNTSRKGTYLLFATLLIWIGSVVLLYNDSRVYNIPTGYGDYIKAFPKTTRNLRMHSSGFFDSAMQLRFDIQSSEMPFLEKNLACRLRPVSSKQPRMSVLGTNDRFWYRPDLSKKHRSCNSEDLSDLDEMNPFSVLVDLSSPEEATVYMLVER